MKNYSFEDCMSKSFQSCRAGTIKNWQLLYFVILPWSGEWGRQMLEPGQV
jgi:hypothetical protein